MKRLTDFQLGLIEIMQLPDAKETVVSTRKRSNAPVEIKKTAKGYICVEHDRRKDKEGPVARYFRERYSWNGSISLKAMGKEMWSVYQSIRYHYKKHGNFDGL